MFTMNAKIQQLFAFPLPERAEYATKLFEEFTIKELEELFPVLIADIFGLNSMGWGLRTTHYSANPRTYNYLLSFFHPSGPFLKLCYKLLSDSCVKYDFPFQYLPDQVCQQIENGVSSSFYQSRAQIDHRSRNPVSLSLNPLELFLFNFGYHLVNPWIANSADFYDIANVESLYARLTHEYLLAFLPIDNSQVLPPVYNSVSMHRIRSPVQSSPRTMRSSTIFKPGVFLLQEPPPTLSTRSQISRPEIWRSELLAQVLIDFWLNIPSQSSQLPGSPTLSRSRKSPVGGSYVRSSSTFKVARKFTDSTTSIEHFRLVRVMIKHFHYFSNSRADGSEAMLEFRRSLLISCQKNIYLFLKEAMQHWPIDSSFRLVEETWLSYIQPWRYTSNRWRLNEDVSQEPIDSVWLQFIASNLLLYTYFFQQVVGRFARLDLATPKNSCMLFRFTKVFATPNLMDSLKEVENGLNKSSSLGVIARQSILDMEGSNFIYEPITGSSSVNLFVGFKTVIEQALNVAQSRLETDRSLEKKSFWSTLFTTNYDAQESVEERKKTPFFLSQSLNHLRNIFPNFDCVDSSVPFSSDLINSSFLSASFRYQDDDSLNSSRKQKRLKLKYQGDPDLQPIRSWECAVFVRILFHLSFCINTLFKDTLKELYWREDLVGGIARQILCGPQVIYYYNKHSESGYCPRVSRLLPPRLSLRSLASYGYLALLPFFYLFMCIFDMSFVAVSLWLSLAILSVMVIRAKLGHFPVPSQPLDESGCSNASHCESD
ncbi:unnamed protein product [Bemisia tabaci]|uniref:Sphingomyelin phosphodiesterase 4 n=1 Tax=Bemisia tabaci TaxID=7038 RepID=A0A9P0AF64_BEMTA|nr:unnamed protein product [Bemisia tabaci]